MPGRQITPLIGSFRLDAEGIVKNQALSRAGMSASISGQRPYRD
ncbi:MAG: hypothetical protein ACYCSS_01645 [Sulfuriferula sp.]